MSPVFDISLMNTQMCLVANFAVKSNQVMFMYHSRCDTCHVLVNMKPIGYFKGDDYFRYSNHNEICKIEMPSKSVYNFEKEYIPVYVSTVTEFLLTGFYDET